IHTQRIDVGAAPDPDAVSVSVAPATFDTTSANLPPVDFDLTGQFATQTVQIDLDANDPVSEADFHLAYGLYDEAALLLKQAAAKDPRRTDIGIKLAETYFAAGKVPEFEQTALELKDRLPVSEWQKLAIMGQQLDPLSRLFGDAAQAPLASELDLSFDAPSATAGSPPATHTASAGGLEFRLDDLELSSLDAGKADAPLLGKSEMVEFDLGDFDIGQPSAAAPATQAPIASDRGTSVDFDLGGFDIEPVPASAPPAAAAAADTELRLEEFDFDAIPADSGEISGDEAGTKLDLARAYVDMGDNEMARGLLSEVLQQGSDAQKQEARGLLGRLA
ncbi:MAG: FimV/HubP family polar landmark protein, partial [Solimonas sp.]